MSGSFANVAVFLPSKKPTEEGLTPVIFIHAMLCTKEIWEDIPRKVADRTNRVVYTYDAPCHGTRINDTEFSFKIIFDDLESMMRKLKLEKAILVGHSMGGKAAIRAALKCPEKVEKVFIVDMHTGEISDELIARSKTFLGEWRKAVQKLPSSVRPKEVTRKSIDLLYQNLEIAEQLPTEKQSFLDSKFVYKNLRDGTYDVSFNVDALMKGLAQCKDDDLSGQYDGPSYFLYGTASPYKVGNTESQIRSYFLKAEMISFSKAPHHVFVHSPQKFVDILVERIKLAA